MESIDWVAHHRALKRVDWNKKVFILKLSHRWLPAGAKMLTWKKQCHDECKLSKHSETNDYLFQCPQRGIWRADFLDKLKLSHSTTPKRLGIRLIDWSSSNFLKQQQTGVAFGGDGSTWL